MMLFLGEGEGGFRAGMATGQHLSVVCAATSSATASILIEAIDLVYVMRV